MGEVKKKNTEFENGLNPTGSSPEKNPEQISQMKPFKSNS